MQFVPRVPMVPPGEDDRAVEAVPGPPQVTGAHDLDVGNAERAQAREDAGWRSRRRSDTGVRAELGYGPRPNIERAFSWR